MTAATAATRAQVIAAVLAASACAEGAEEVGGANAGRFVERVQARTGNRRGDPWCASWVFDVGERMATALGYVWPLPRTASCDALLRAARARGLLRAVPTAGDVFLVLRTDTDAIHTGFVVSVPAGQGHGFVTREGNTNPTGGREGYGVFRRQRGHSADRTRYAFIHWPAALVATAPTGAR